MKRTIKHTVALNTIGILLLCHWGNNDEASTSVAGGGKKPAVNFYGTVMDNTETSVGAEYITISGLYSQFPVYYIPKNLNHKDYNPADNMARLDLAEISKISIPDPEKIYTFLNRTYLEIHVLSNDNVTTNTYIIETGKKIFFDEINESGPIEREIALTALKEVNIKGYKETAKETDKNKSVPAKNILSKNPSAQFPEDEDTLYLDHHYENISHKKPVVVPGL